MTALTAAGVVTIWTVLGSVDAGIVNDPKVVFSIGCAVSPYLWVLIAGQLIVRFTRLPDRSVVFFVISVLMLAFTLAAYPSIPSGPSSTAAIAFVTVPIDLFFGSFVFMTAGLGVAWAMDRKPSRREL